MWKSQQYILYSITMADAARTAFSDPHFKGANMRDTSTKIPLRKQAPWRVHDAINNRTCLHKDAWIYQDSDDVLYLRIVLSAAGRHVVDSKLYRCMPDYGGTLREIQDQPDIAARCVQRQCDSPWARRNAPWLNAIHWRHVAPLIRNLRRGFLTVSINLHYVWSNPIVNDPMAGIDNLYAISGRQGRDIAKIFDVVRRAKMEIAALPYVPPKPASQYTRKERSVLRTLDKILKN